jgi:hypothetical protein
LGKTCGPIFLSLVRISSLIWATHWPCFLISLFHWHFILDGQVRWAFIFNLFSFDLVLFWHSPSLSLYLFHSSKFPFLNLILFEFIWSLIYRWIQILKSSSLFTLRHVAMPQFENHPRFPIWASLHLFFSSKFLWFCFCFCLHLSFTSIPWYA